MYYGPKGDGVPAVKRFLTEMEGMGPWTWWPHNEVGHSQEAKNESQALFDGEYVFDTAKPERLIQRIIHIATNPGEIVLDFFSGSGTTAAVAQKMKRTWIAVEQLDYVVDLPGERLKKVIAGEQGGISKSENWTGGGSFVFAKLAQHNDLFAKRVTTAKDSKELLEIWSEMQATGYLRYDIQLNEFVTEEFLPLPLAEQKQILLDPLEANHLYVNLNSLGDQTLTIDENDLKLTLEFYGITE